MEREERRREEWSDSKGKYMQGDFIRRSRKVCGCLNLDMESVCVCVGPLNEFDL